MRLAAVLALAFWVLITIGGTANPGYLQYEQYVSALAARGAADPWWGIAAMACLTGSLLVVGPALRGWNPFVAWSVTGAGAGMLVATAVPIGCPPGERFCTTPGGAWPADIMHAAAVLVTAAALFFALCAGLIQLWRGSWRQRDSLIAAFAAATALAVTGYPLLTVTGLQQRLMILLVQLGLIAAAAAARGEEKRRERVLARQAAQSRPTA